MRTGVIWACLAAPLILPACSYNERADQAMEAACSDTGSKARDGYRALRHDDYVAGDRAVCVRCPGERELTCTGEPLALPRD